MTKANWQQELYDDYQRRKGIRDEAPKSEPQPQIIKQSGRQPNKTELRFEMEYLKPWIASGIIQNYDYEAITLKIANGCKYTPDWYVLDGSDEDGIEKNEFYEIKARNMIWDDAIVKIKVAAKAYPQFEFWLCAWDSKTGWQIQRVLP